MAEQSKFPPGWDADRVNRVIDHYEQQTETEAIAEDDARLEYQRQPVGAASVGRVGFVGLGRMGLPMSYRLLEAGFDLTVHNRSQGKVQEIAFQKIMIALADGS